MIILFTVLTFVLLISADVIIRKVKSKKAIAEPEVSVKTSVNIPFSVKVKDLILPSGLFFHRGHTWASIDISGKVKIGLDDFAQKILGRIDGIKPHKIGDTVKCGEKIFTVKQGEREADFNSPVDGIISFINEDVINNPIELKNNPYEKSWIYSIKPTNLSQNIKSLLIAEKAMDWLRNEVQRFEIFITEHFEPNKTLGKTLADGGMPIEGVMEYMDDKAWSKLQEEFWTK